MTQAQKDAILELLWDYLQRDPQFSEYRHTGWGTKTKLGLISCIERICRGDFL